LLSLHIGDAELKQFYKNLMISEAGHYKLFLDMACELSDKETVMNRWDEWLQYEAEIMQNIALRGDRVH